MSPSESEAMFPPRPTALVHQILAGLLHEGDWVIDATAGNGHDTHFLAECVGSSGRVLAFDVQPAAIAASRLRIMRAGLAERVEFFQESHTQIERHIPQACVAAVLFNLGYLPGEDHALTTEATDTLAALEAAVRVLKNPGGVISVICYPGHPAGLIEAEAVEAWMAKQATHGWRVAKYGAIHTRRPAPFLLLARNATNYLLARGLTSQTNILGNCFLI